MLEIKDIHKNFGKTKVLKGVNLNVSEKDIVVITSISGKKYIYEVEVIEVLQPDDVVEMIENEFDLTLYTCTKDNLNRVTVRLNKIKEN